MSEVVITRDDDVQAAIGQALGHLDFEPLVRGRLVAVKPNETWASAEDTNVGARRLGFEVQAVRHLWEAARLGIGESKLDRMSFPAMGLDDAIGAFTDAAYGERLTFPHA